jgi:hypothetical protein
MDVHGYLSAGGTGDVVEKNCRAGLADLGQGASCSRKIGLKFDLFGNAQQLLLLLEHAEEFTKVLICAHEVASFRYKLPQAAARSAAIWRCQRPNTACGSFSAKVVPLVTVAYGALWIRVVSPSASKQASGMSGGGCASGRARIRSSHIPQSSDSVSVSRPSRTRLAVVVDCGKSAKRIRPGGTTTMSPALSSAACGQPAASTVDRRNACVFANRPVPSR